MSSLSLDPLDLAALLCSRVCHDVISPVGAIVNGLEVLEEESDPEMKGFAMELIRKSAQSASARLQFCRLAFGAAGSAGASIDTGDAENVARGLLADEKTQIVWEIPRQLMPKNLVKLLLNLCLLASGTIPRGGILHVGLGESSGGKTTFILRSSGSYARLSPHILPLLRGELPEGGSMDSHGIQPFYTGLMAQACGLVSIAEVEETGTIRFEAYYSPNVLDSAVTIDKSTQDFSLQNNV